MPGRAKVDPVSEATRRVRWDGVTLARRRIELGLDRRELARRIGEGTCRYVGWETGRGCPNGDQIAKLADELGVAPADLFSRRGAIVATIIRRR